MRLSRSPWRSLSYKKPRIVQPGGFFSEIRNRILFPSLCLCGIIKLRRGFLEGRGTKYLTPISANECAKCVAH